MQILRLNYPDGGSRKITHDLRNLGESCGKHRVYQLMHRKACMLKLVTVVIRIVTATLTWLRPTNWSKNLTSRLPNQAWVMDITYIPAHQGWLYLAAVLDLFSRQVISWSMRSRIDSKLVLKALLMVICRRNPVGPVIVHSDQGSQYNSHGRQAL